MVNLKAVKKGLQVESVLYVSPALYVPIYGSFQNFTLHTIHFSHSQSSLFKFMFHCSCVILASLHFFPPVILDFFDAA